MPGHQGAARGRAGAMIAVAVFAIVAAVLGLPGLAVAGAPVAAHPTPRQIERFWTPRRMAAARPLELSLGRDRRAHVHLGPRPRVAARAAYSVVEAPEAPPFAANGRLYVREGEAEAFCSATAIDSPSRRLVLTAGHCLDSGPRDGKAASWATYLEFVPGFNLGTAPFGTFALSGRPWALPGWIKDGNPDFDLGAFLTEPNAEGVAVADAVGGGARIVTDLDRHQRFETFGYPGNTERMRTCVSGFAGEARSIIGSLPGPSPTAVRCDWAPGASGGAWLIDDGQEIDGLNSYVLGKGKGRLTFGPYFSVATVGRLVAGI